MMVTAVQSWLYKIIAIGGLQLLSLQTNQIIVKACNIGPGIPAPWFLFSCFFFLFFFFLLSFSFFSFFLFPLCCGTEHTKHAVHQIGTALSGHTHFLENQLPNKRKS